MSPHLENQLVDQYPALFGRGAVSSSSSLHWGIECADGWYDLLDGLCREIQAYVVKSGSAQVVFSQIKEKFGELRIYYSPPDLQVDQLIDSAVDASERICEFCGCEAYPQKTSQGWIKTICSACLHN